METLESADAVEESLSGERRCRLFSRTQVCDDFEHDKEDSRAAATSSLLQDMQRPICAAHAGLPAVLLTLVVCLLERVGDSSLVPTSWILGLASEPLTARPLAPPGDRQARIIEQVTRPQQSRVSRRSSTASSIATWLGGRTSARHAKAWTRISELRALDGIPGPEQRGLLSCHVSATSPALCRCSAHSRLGNARGAVPSGSSLLRLPLFLALSPRCRVLHELHCQACAGLYSLSPSRRSPLSSLRHLRRCARLVSTSIQVRPSQQLLWTAQYSSL